MVKLSVCIGSACHVQGANNVVVTFQHMIEEYGLHDKIDFSASFCMKQCAKRSVGVRLNGEEHRVKAEEARSFFKEKILPLVQ